MPLSLSLCTASDPKLPSTHPIKRSTLLHLFVSAARDILVSSPEAVQMTLGDAIVLRHRIFKQSLPTERCIGKGGHRKEGEGGKWGEPFTGEGKRNPQRSKINDS